MCAVDCFRVVVAILMLFFGRQSHSTKHFPRLCGPNGYEMAQRVMIFVVIAVFRHRECRSVQSRGDSRSTQTCLQQAFLRYRIAQFIQPGNRGMLQQHDCLAILDRADSNHP
jgi:hypothetical protein